jgi:C4-type Zn-finger protein
MFYLEYPEGGSPDIKCPRCGEEFKVVWNTEYSEPSFGEHEAECTKCKKVFVFSVFASYTC